LRRRALTLLVPLVLSVAVPLRAQEKGEGPASLFLFYNCKPEKRAAFRAYMEGPGVAQFEKWKKQGVYSDYLVLFSSFVNGNWDMLVRLDFEKYVDSDRWKAIEKTTPAGLSPEGLAICSPTDSDLADLLWTKGPATRNLGKAVYLVMPFMWEHSKNLYFSYFEARPKYDLDAWVDDGTLSWYGAFVNQHHTGAKWNVLWLLEYKDSLALARREVVKQAVRKEKAAKQEEPAYKFVRQTGNESRAASPAVVADPILPR
jgi:hypothetical protein